MCAVLSPRGPEDLQVGDWPELLEANDLVVRLLLQIAEVKRGALHEFESVGFEAVASFGCIGS